MRIELPFAEALSFATARSPLPPFVTSIRCDDDTIRAVIDLRGIRVSSTAARFALAAAGDVDVTARPTGYADGVLTVALTAHAWGLPAHRLVPLLVDRIDDALRDAGVPDGAVRIERGDPHTVVRVDVQRLIAERVSGLVVTAFSLGGAVLRADAVVSGFEVR